MRHTEKLNTEDVNRLKQFALDRGWQLYLQAAGPDSLKRMDDEHAEMRLHYRLNDFDVAFGFNPHDFTQVN